MRIPPAIFTAHPMPEADAASVAQVTINHAVVEGKREHRQLGNPSRDEAGDPTGEPRSTRAVNASPRKARRAPSAGYDQAIGTGGGPGGAIGHAVGATAASGAQHWLRDTRRFCFRRNRSASGMFLVQK